jgi:hypothetical protein
MFMDEDMNVKKTILQTGWQEFYWRNSKHILLAQNSLSCCLHHTCTLAKFNGQKMGKLFGDGSRLHAVCQSTTLWVQTACRVSEHHPVDPDCMQGVRAPPWTLCITQDRQHRAAGRCWYTPFEVYDSSNVVVTWFEINK